MTDSPPQIGAMCLGEIALCGKSSEPCAEKLPYRYGPDGTPRKLESCLTLLLLGSRYALEPPLVIAGIYSGEKSVNETSRCTSLTPALTKNE